MYYYIDGYNLLFRLVKVGGDLKEERKRIIEEFSLKLQFIGLEACFVFDAHYSTLESSRSYLHDLQIIFTEIGESADEFIIDEVDKAKNPRQITVVTSDNKLAWRARRKAAHSESIENFVKWLDKRYKNKKSRRPKDSIKEAVRVPRPPIPKKDPLPPPPKATAEEFGDYYIHIFEEKFAQEEAIRPKKDLKPKKRQQTKPRLSKKEDISKTESPLGDAGWIALFENELNAQKHEPN